MSVYQSCEWQSNGLNRKLFPIFCQVFSVLMIGTLHITCICMEKLLCYFDASCQSVHAGQCVDLHPVLWDCVACSAHRVCLLRWHHLRYQFPSPRVIFASLISTAAFFCSPFCWVYFLSPRHSPCSPWLAEDCRCSYHMLCHFVNLLIRKYDLCQFWPSGDVHLPGGLLGACSEKCCACRDVHMVEDSECRDEASEVRRGAGGDGEV